MTVRVTHTMKPWLLVVAVVMLTGCFARDADEAPVAEGEQACCAQATANDEAELADDTTTERRALDWLRDHQHPDGYWSAAGFAEDSVREGAISTRNLGKAASDTGPADADFAVTALALLAFVREGFDHKYGIYRDVVRRTLVWIRAQLDGRRFQEARDVVDHALVTMTLCEAYGSSGDQALRDTAEDAVAGLLSQRETGSGWARNPGGEPDMISTGHAVFALTSARMCGVEVDHEEAYRDVGSFLDRLADEDGTIRYSEQEADPPINVLDGYERLPACEAAWLTSALFLGHIDVRDKRVQALADKLVRQSNLPQWEVGRIDLEYWWFASHAIFGVRGKDPSGRKRWPLWKSAMAEVLPKHQRGQTAADAERGRNSSRKLDEFGSWDALDIWNAGGRVYATALGALVCTWVFGYHYTRLEED